MVLFFRNFLFLVITGGFLTSHGSLAEVVCKESYIDIHGNFLCIKSYSDRVEWIEKATVETHKQKHRVNIYGCKLTREVGEIRVSECEKPDGFEVVWNGKNGSIFIQGEMLGFDNEFFKKIPGRKTVRKTELKELCYEQAVACSKSDFESRLAYTCLLPQQDQKSYQVTRVIPKEDQGYVKIDYGVYERARFASFGPHLDLFLNRKAAPERDYRTQIPFEINIHLNPSDTDSNQNYFKASFRGEEAISGTKGAYPEDYRKETDIYCVRVASEVPNALPYQLPKPSSEAEKGTEAEVKDRQLSSQSQAPQPQTPSGVK